jgi:hypothetical protein
LDSRDLQAALTKRKEEARRDLTSLKAFAAPRSSTEVWSAVPLSPRSAAAGAGVLAFEE